MKTKKLVVLAFALTVLACLAAGRSGDEPRKFLILIDFRHNDLAGVALAKDAALFFLGSEVRDEDEVALMLFSDVRDFQVIEEFTKDHDKIRRGLKAMIDVPGPAGIDGGGMALMTEPTPPETPPASAPVEGSGAGALRESVPAMRNTQPLFANSAMSRVSPMRDRVYLDQMKDLAEFLTEVPGRKNIIYYSLGFPAFRYQDDTTFREKFDAMASGFSAAQAPVYTVNTLGHRQDSVAIAAKVDFLLGKFATLSGGRYYGRIEKYKDIAKDLGKIAGS
jgi:VWFA-related protein